MERHLLSNHSRKIVGQEIQQIRGDPFLFWSPTLQMK